ncbi:MAG: GNAT family N-acetyltransferase [Anaerolineae bacterium]|nr:GNAT family N-acetyltransferase [Anaerolineae bacterium]
MLLRQAEPGDYAPIISVINDWWGGRQMADMLPKLFFVHFRDTSFVIECEDERVAFLIGLQSQTDPDQAYIHFVGVHPDYRKDGLGRSLYERFFEAAKTRGCKVVRCVTSPVNKPSIGFHLRMGFEPEAGNATSDDGVPVHQNYDGRGEDRVLFRYDLK